MTLQNSGEYASVEEAIQQIAKSIQSGGLTLTPIFHECGMLCAYVVYMSVCVCVCSYVCVCAHAVAWLDSISWQGTNLER